MPRHDAVTQGFYRKRSREGAENKIGVYFRNLGDRKLEGRSEGVRLEDGRPSRKESAVIFDCQVLHIEIFSLTVLTASLRYNWYTINCAYLKYTVDILHTYEK